MPLRKDLVHHLLFRNSVRDFNANSRTGTDSVIQTSRDGDEFGKLLRAPLETVCQGIFKLKKSDFFAHNLVRSAAKPPNAHSGCFPLKVYPDMTRFSDRGENISKKVARPYPKSDRTTFLEVFFPRKKSTLILCLKIPKKFIVFSEDFQEFH